MNTTAFTATTEHKTSRDGKTLTRIYRVLDAEGQETGRRTSKSRDYAALRVMPDGSILSAHETLAAAQKAQAAQEYGHTGVVVIETTPPAAAVSEEPPAPKIRRGRKSKAEREAEAAKRQGFSLTFPAAAAAGIATYIRTTDAGAGQAWLPRLVTDRNTVPPLPTTTGVPTMEQIEAAAQAAAAERAGRAAAKPKAEPKPVHPAGEVGSAAWKDLLAHVEKLWETEDGKADAAALLVQVHREGAPIKPLDTLARQGKTRGLAKAWWNLWTSQPEYRGRAAA